MKKFFQNIFSVVNDKQHKVVTVLGIKLKFRRKTDELYRICKKQLAEVRNISRDLKNKDAVLATLMNAQNKDGCRLNTIEQYCARHLNKKPWGLIDSVNGTFRRYFIENNMVEKVELFKKNLDEESLKITDIVIDKMLRLPDESLAYLCNLDFKAYKLRYDIEKDKKYERLLAENADNIKSSYKLSKPNYDMEVFLYHHGLKFANNKIIEYVKNKDFIDAGAYIGDSALVLLEYSPNKIHSFEISQGHVENYKRTMHLNNISEGKYVINMCGLSSECSSVKINNNGDMGKKIYNGNGELVKTIILDSYIQKVENPIGFIKADIEGAMFDALKGMVKTIRKYRPVLSFAIYHSAEEFFETKILLDEITKDLDYSVHIDSHFSESMHIYGTVLFAYPRELDN